MALRPQTLRYLDASDGLVLIHVDYSDPQFMALAGNPCYLENLAEATFRLKHSGKPVFSFPRYANDDSYIPRDLYESWTLIPSSNNYGNPSTPRLLQDHVRFMAEVIGKKPSEITLAGGGIALTVCVNDFMSYWCRDITPKITSVLNYYLPEKIGRGYLLPQLTDNSAFQFDADSIREHPDIPGAHGVFQAVPSAES